jgi:hypothetical protein
MPDIWEINYFARESNKALAINKIWSEINVCLLPEAVTNFVENDKTRLIRTGFGWVEVDVKCCCVAEISTSWLVKL